MNNKTEWKHTPASTSGIASCELVGDTKRVYISYDAHLFDAQSNGISLTICAKKNANTCVSAVFEGLPLGDYRMTADGGMVKFCDSHKMRITADYIKTYHDRGSTYISVLGGGAYIILIRIIGEGN